jgi:predicted anti-sigma-YlaC factor YlaD
MTCQSARESFPALLDSRTAATAHLEAREHLAHCPDCQRDFAALSQTLAALDAMPMPAPTPRLRQNFYAMLEEEKHSAASVRAVARREHRATLWRWVLVPFAAAALLLLGFLAGTRYAPSNSAADEKIARLDRKLDQMNKLVGYSLLQQQQNPTNERLQGVLTAAKAEKPDAKVYDALISAVAFDPSANVRLRALEALFPHIDEPMVRAGVLAALPREQNPLVQLEMIDFVASTHDREAAPVLEKLTQNEALDGTVRDAAQRALAIFTPTNR